MPTEPQPMVEPYDERVLGANFPPGLNTASRPGDLEVDETPDGYGYDLSKDGVIAKGTIPSTSNRTLKSVTLTEGALSVPYYWAYNRLWNITNRTVSTASTTLTYGALNYDDIYVPQRLGKIPFNDTASTILAIQPFAQDAMWIATASGGYVLGNLSDTRAFWGRSHLIEEVKTGGATGLIEVDGVVYSASANGLYAYDRGAGVEMTRKVRDDLTNFGNVALTVNYEKKYVAGGTSYVYEIPTQKLFRWSASGFRWTSRQFHLRNWEPFRVDRVLFTVKHADSNNGWLKYQVKVEDDAWRPEEMATVLYDEGEYTIFKLTVETQMCRKWQIRLTDIASNIYIKEVRLDYKGQRQDDYDR